MAVSIKTIKRVLVVAMVSAAMMGCEPTDKASETAASLTADQCKIVLGEVNDAIIQFRKTKNTTVADALDTRFANSAFAFDRTSAGLHLREDVVVTDAVLIAAGQLASTADAATLDAAMNEAMRRAVCESASQVNSTAAQNDYAVAFHARLAHTL